MIAILKNIGLKAKKPLANLYALAHGVILAFL